MHSSRTDRCGHWGGGYVSSRHPPWTETCPWTETSPWLRPPVGNPTPLLWTDKHPWKHYLPLRSVINWSSFRSSVLSAISKFKRWNMDIPVDRIFCSIPVTFILASIIFVLNYFKFCFQPLCMILSKTWRYDVAFHVAHNVKVTKKQISRLTHHWIERLISIHPIILT